MDTATNTLALQGFGARLRVKDGLFAVTVPDLSGANNHREEEFAAQSVDTILLHLKTSVSADALLLAQRHNVNVLLLDEHEMPTSFFAGLHPPSSILIWKQQLMLHDTPQGLAYARDWLCTKTRRQIEWLTKMRSYREGQALTLLEDCLASLRDTLVSLSNAALSPVKEAAARLRGIEGASQRKYLSTLSALLPPQSRFEGRSRQPAADLFNALLNYGYGILYNWVERALWESGLNPYIGFLHGSEDRHHKTLLYDFIEQYRPWVDKVAFKLCTSKVANAPQHTRERPGGGMWLNAEGKRLMVERTMEKFNRKQIEIGERTWQLRAAVSQEAKILAMALWRVFGVSSSPMAQPAVPVPVR